MMKINDVTTLYDFDHLCFIKDLIFYGSPLLSLYINSITKKYVLFYWVDVENNINRWLFFEVDFEDLFNYLNCKISLKKLIVFCSEKELNSVDITERGEYINIRKVDIFNIDSTYLPKNDSFYDVSLGNGNGLLDLLSHSSTTGILEISFHGPSIKKGAIDLEKFAETIDKIDCLNNELTKKFVKHNVINPREKRELSKDLTMELFSLKASSFKLYLKPKFPNNIPFPCGTFVDNYFYEFIDLISSGYSKEKIALFEQKYQKNILRLYNRLIKSINKYKFDFSLTWVNTNMGVTYKKEILKKDTTDILKNLSFFKLDDNDEITLTGHFYAVDIKKFKYAFESNDNEISKGVILPSLIEYVTTVSFEKQYTIKISRDIKEQYKKRTQIIDELISIELYND